MSKRKTIEEFISEATEKHAGKYSYDAITSEIWNKPGGNRTIKVPIICAKHGIFWQTIANHLNKGANGEYHGCPQCAKETKQINNPRNSSKKHYGRKTTEEFILEAKKIHGDNYNYDLVNYKNAKSKIKIKCNICGNVFEQTPDHHVNRKDGCPFCRNKYFSESQQYSKKEAEQFITDAINEEKFEILEYHGFKKDALMRCKKCGFKFWRAPINAQRLKCQCPSCDTITKGEAEILKVLETLDIKYIYQYRADWLGLQSLDFYLDELNIGIEYDGVQHFEPVETFGGEGAFEIQKTRDKIKNELCEKNNIKLIRIPYWDFNNIEKILNEQLKS